MCFWKLEAAGSSWTGGPCNTRSSFEWCHLASCKIAWDPPLESVRRHNRDTSNTSFPLTTAVLHHLDEQMRAALVSHLNEEGRGAC